MKRMKNIFRTMEKDTSTYTKLYSAPIGIVPPFGEPYGDLDTTFYNDRIGFTVELSHRLAQDCPYFVIKIPFDLIYPDEFLKQKEADIPLKRLKYYFRQMENDTSTYAYKGEDGRKHDIYDGDTIIHYPEPPSTPDRVQPPSRENNPTYYADSHSFTLEKSHKMEIDKPIVNIAVPVEEIAQLPELSENPALAYSPYGYPVTLQSTLETAAADFCLRAFMPYLDALNEVLYNRSRPDRENGRYYIHHPGGEILIRNTAYFAMCPQRDYEYLSGNSVKVLDDGIARPPQMCLCLRIQVQLPAGKLKRAMMMLTSDLPEAVDLFVAELNRKKLAETLALAEKQFRIRAALEQSPYTAFVANGSILPRAKGGVLPMEGAVPFISTPAAEIEIAGVRGMGIRRGVTVITGGGYSGKSTLLDAISAGIYDHCAGDGRELVITDASAVSIAAEDGRGVRSVNISPFIKELPSGDTASFSTEHASGSTSQAANIMEAVDSGAKLLLIDEDRSATNFMIRDSKMKALIHREPITPFTDRVRELASNGISTILVIGGSGEYLGVADRVYLMDEYRISDVTAKAGEIWQASDSEITIPAPAQWNQTRRITADGFTSYPEGSHTERLEVSDIGALIIGDEKIDIRGLYNTASAAQQNGIALILRYAMISRKPGPFANGIDGELDRVYEMIRRDGVHEVFSSFFTTVSMPIDLPRKAEIKAVVSRMRRLIWIK